MYCLLVPYCDRADDSWQLIVEPAATPKAPLALSRIPSPPNNNNNNARPLIYSNTWRLRVVAASKEVSKHELEHLEMAWLSACPCMSSCLCGYLTVAICLTVAISLWLSACPCMSSCHCGYLTVAICLTVAISLRICLPVLVCLANTTVDVGVGKVPHHLW